MDQKRLKELFTYEPDTGILRWRSGGGNKKKSLIAGTPNKWNYLAVKVDGVNYTAHRLAWLYIYGYMPSQLDHIDGNPHNNAIANLREANSYQNARNKRLRKDNKSGFKGVNWHSRDKVWTAQIRATGDDCVSKTYYLGQFSNRLDAAKAYNEAAIRLHGEFAYLNDLTTSSSDSNDNTEGQSAGYLSFGL